LRAAATKQRLGMYLTNPTVSDSHEIPKQMCYAHIYIYYTCREKILKGQREDATQNDSFHVVGILFYLYILS
jgi:hypothetical protein